MNFVPKRVLKPSAILKHMEISGYVRVWGRKLQIIIHNITSFLKTCFGYKYKQKNVLGKGLGLELLRVTSQGTENYRGLSVY